ncbi:MAG: ADP-ribosylglycohydrolase family protein, partial [Gammaproteobacteria bacterium]|nr:ADP-ribosylglycohydrolase family protein [Gammaproteobacteria bacterium]
AATVYAALMLAALGGVGRDGLIGAARELWRAHAAAPAGIFDVAVGAAPTPRPALDHADPAVTDPFAVLGLVVGAVTASAGFREGLLGLVNRGGDADLHGALFGQLAGALYGVEAIPAAWRAGLLRRALLQDFVDRLLIAALAPHD